MYPYQKLNKMPVARKSYVRKYKKPKSFTARVRKVITSAAQLKHITNTSFTSGMDSDVMYFTSPTQNVSQGTAIGQRIGDEIKLHALKLNGFINSTTAALACAKFRVAVFYSSANRAASSVTTGAFTATELFLPNTINTPANGIFDDKALTVLADVLIDVNSLVSNAQDIKSFAVSVPLKDVRARFGESGGAFVDKKNLYIMVTGYTPVAANILDIGTYSYSYDLQFKDI